MSTEATKEPWWIDERESAVPGFSVRDVHFAVGIVDSEPDIEDDLIRRVTPENLDALIGEEMRRLVLERAAANEEGFEGKSAAELMELEYDRNSSSHAIQCSVSRAKDFGDIRGLVGEMAAKKGIGTDDADARLIGEFAQRQEILNGLTTELLKKDIARRFGRKKGDPAFFEKAMADFGPLADRILASLDALEQVDASQIAKNDDVRQQFDTLRKRLQAAKTASPRDLDADFYGDICLIFSSIVFQDSDAFNEKKIMAAAKRLSAERAA